MTLERQARDLLQRMGIKDVQRITAGDVVELANLIGEAKRLRKAADRALTFIAAGNYLGDDADEAADVLLELNEALK